MSMRNMMKALNPEITDAELLSRYKAEHQEEEKILRGDYAVRAFKPELQAELKKLDGLNATAKESLLTKSHSALQEAKAKDSDHTTDMETDFSPRSGRPM